MYKRGNISPHQPLTLTLYQGYTCGRLHQILQTPALCLKWLKASLKTFETAALATQQRGLAGLLKHHQGCKSCCEVHKALLEGVSVFAGRQRT